MSLILELDGPQVLPNNGGGSQRVIGKQGGSIGRAASNDIVLVDTDRYISSQHALLSYANGIYFLTDTSSNGVYLNDSEEPIGHKNTAQLSTGDCFFIGEYEFSVAINEDLTDSSMGGAHFGTPPSFDFADTTSPTQKFFSDSVSESVGLNSGNINNSSNDQRINSSAFLDQNSNPISDTVSDHVPSEQQFFEAPAPRPVQAHSVDCMADEWLEGWPSSGDASDAMPDATGQDSSRYSEDQNIIRPANHDTGPSLSQNQSSLSSSTTQGQHSTPSPVPAATRNPHPAQTQVKTTPPRQSSNAELALAEFALALGFTGDDLACVDLSLWMREIGESYRAMVEGLMAVLSARMKVKSEFRMDVTTIRPIENNPLKFAPTVDEALGNMLFQRNRGYLDAKQALSEALSDIRNHEVATITGMTEFNKFMKRFEPECLIKEFEKEGKASLLRNKKAQFWCLYTESFKKMVDDANSNGYQDVFDHVFSHAYNQQINLLSKGKK